MIKELIKDLAYDKITLTQGLTRAKIIAFKIQNPDFQTWINNELEGYNNTPLPKYRKITCVVKATIMDPFTQSRETVPVSFDDDANEIGKLIKAHKFEQSCSSLEDNYNSIESEKGIIEFIPEQVKLLEKYMDVQNRYGRMMVAAHKEIPKLQIKNILDQTKQKLINTLLNLEKEFPNLENDFAPTNENNEKVQNIITNNVFGNNSPINVAAGNKVEQKDISIVITETHYSELEKLGVEKNDIEELKEIVKSNSNNKTTLKGHAMKWLGRVTASVAARGLYDNIPAITDFVTNLL